MVDRFSLKFAQHTNVRSAGSVLDVGRERGQRYQSVENLLAAAQSHFRFTDRHRDHVTVLVRPTFALHDHFRLFLADAHERLELVELYVFVMRADELQRVLLDAALDRRHYRFQRFGPRTVHQFVGLRVTFRPKRFADRVDLLQFRIVFNGRRYAAPQELGRAQFVGVQVDGEQFYILFGRQASFLNFIVFQFFDDETEKPFGTGVTRTVNNKKKKKKWQVRI